MFVSNCKFKGGYTLKINCHKKYSINYILLLRKFHFSSLPDKYRRQQLNKVGKQNMSFQMEEDQELQRSFKTTTSKETFWAEGLRKSRITYFLLISTKIKHCMKTYGSYEGHIWFLFQSSHHDSGSLNR